MLTHAPRIGLASMAFMSLVSLCGGTASSAAHRAAAAGSGPPGTQMIRNVDLSGNGPSLAASVPKIAWDPRDPSRIAVVWRFVATAAASAQDRSPLDWSCHLSRSTDGGAHFTDQVINWGVPRTTRCNAPYVDYSSSGDLYIGATLMAPAVAGPNGKVPPFGRAVIRRSNDGGRTWSNTVSVIATDSQSRFAANPAIPEAARLVPWDGASGVVDRNTGAIFVAGGYPAPPGGAAHSQRFFARSTDGGSTWGLIRALGSVEWPERWDGHLAAAHGELAAGYIADDVPLAHAPCPCVVFGTSQDGGRTFRRHYLGSVSNIDRLVHYPPIAADPVRRGVFALALVSDDAREVSVWLSADDGSHWARVTMKEPADVIKTSRPALAYAPDQTLVAMWRGYHANGSFDVYVAAAADGRHFNGATRLSTESSRTPDSMSSNYAVRGDFINSVAADGRFVHAVWTDWRSGTEARVYYGRLPLKLLLATGR